MTHPIRFAAWLVAATLAAACQPVATLPAPSAVSTPQAAASVDPCVVPSAIPSGTELLTFDGYDAVPGLTSSAVAEDGQVPVVLYLAMLPRPEGYLQYVMMQYEISGPTGVLLTPPMMLSAVFSYINAVSDQKIGRLKRQPLYLPIAPLAPYLKRIPGPTSVTARLQEFQLSSGLKAIDATGQPFTVAIPLSLTDAPTPAAASRLSACGLTRPSPVPDGPVPPRIVDFDSLKQTGNLHVVEGGEAHATITLVAPPGSAGSPIAAYEVTYFWQTPAGDERQTAPVRVPLAAPLTVAPAQDTASGPKSELQLTFADKDFQEARGQATGVRAHIKFIDDNDFTILDKNFQELTVSLPIALN